MKMMLVSLLVLAAIPSCLWLFAMLVFEADASHDDAGTEAGIPVRQTTESGAHRVLAEQIRHDLQTAGEANAAGLATLRRTMDERGRATRVQSSIRLIDVDGIPAEWLSPPGHVAGRRLLYLHGGGYVAGSAVSHRSIADRLAVALGAEVLVPDYRLLPENPRRAGIEDSFKAWAWLTRHHPDGRTDATTLLLAGDSAGGNLALVTAARARDVGLRIPDVMVLFSPQTDSTLSSPSLHANLERDVLQGPGLRAAVTAPRAALLWSSALMNRINPRSPEVSPLFGELHGLPPILVQVSAVEMFLDDSVRFARRANAAGSPVVLQVWPHTLHAWPVFDLPESGEAIAEVARFVADRVR